MRFRFRLMPAVLLFFVALISGAQQQPRPWPAARFHPAMVSDSDRPVLVLFGGLELNGNILGDTWEWNGAAWRQAAAAGPSLRFGHAMTYDSARKVTVLFGGEDANGVHGDTWEWNGREWKQASKSGPAPRGGAQLAYDSRRRRVVLFGGSDFPKGRNFGDTWEWDGRRWTERKVKGPAARFYHCMAYDAAMKAVVLFGGNTAEGKLTPQAWEAGRRGDTWLFDGKAWRAIEQPGPPARDHHGMSYDPARARIVLFGGFNGAYLNDTWEWDGSRWNRAADGGPPPRGGKPAMAYSATEKGVVLFGGGVGGGTDRKPRTYDDLWVWNGASWKEIGPGEKP
jgi:hypothetical protein